MGRGGAKLARVLPLAKISSAALPARIKFIDADNWRFGFAMPISSKDAKKEGYDD